MALDLTNSGAATHEDEQLIVDGPKEGSDPNLSRILKGERQRVLQMLDEEGVSLSEVSAALELPEEEALAVLVAYTSGVITNLRTALHNMKYQPDQIADPQADPQASGVIQVTVGQHVEIKQVPTPTRSPMREAFLNRLSRFLPKRPPNAA